jgi:ABC-2 type transporter
MCSATANFGIVGTIRSFPKEKAIVSGEIATNMYRTLPYFIGKALSELPPISFFNGLFGILVCRFTGLSKHVGGTTGSNNNKLLRFVTLLSTHGFASQAIGLLLGAVSPSEDFAIALFPAFLVLNLIFDGRNISEENTPWCLRWIRKVSLIRWGYEGLCLCEFEGLTFDSSSGGGKQRRGPVVKNGVEALARLGMGERTISDVFRAQLLITSISWALSWLGLTLTRQRFMVMEAPEDIIIMEEGEESIAATTNGDAHVDAHATVDCQKKIQ